MAVGRIGIQCMFGNSKLATSVLNLGVCDSPVGFYKHI